MKQTVWFFLIVFALWTSSAVANHPSSEFGIPGVVVQQLRSDEPREARDPFDRFIRLLKRVFHVGTYGDGMTPPKP